MKDFKPTDISINNVDKFEKKKENDYKITIKMLKIKLCVFLKRRIIVNQNVPTLRMEQERNQAN